MLAMALDGFLATATASSTMEDGTRQSSAGATRVRALRFSFASKSIGTDIAATGVKPGPSKFGW
jgi:hypothetical protein